jgi:4-amino-4-deoxy-L-arabinose transferase-like glycosyltransferase
MSEVVLLISFAIVLICLSGHLGAMGLVGPDEPRYAWIARAMAQTHDWITPRLYGHPWFEKPVLYYWLAAMGFLLHLPAEWAARLPSAFAALAAAIAIGWLGWQHYERPASIWSISVWSPCLLAPLVFSTSAAAIGFARAATPDMLFSSLLTLAMASAACSLTKRGALRAASVADDSLPDEAANDARPSGDLWPLALFGVFLGLAVLAKGPAAIILAGGAVGLWAIKTRQWKPAFRLAHPLAIAAFCVVALPWYIACARRNPDFLPVFILQHNFERYLTPLYQHRQPFWFFLPVVLLALLPWTTLICPLTQGGRQMWREKTWHDSPGLFFACWVVIPVIFFSFSKSKLPGYVLPSIPPLCLLCSVAAIRAMKTGGPRALRVAQGLGLTWIVTGIAAFVYARRIRALVPEGSHAYAGVLVGGVAVVLAGIFMAGFLANRKKHLVVPLCLLCVAGGVELLNLAVLPALDPVYSARPYAELLRQDLRPERIFTYNLPRAWNWGLAFYFGRELPEWSSADPEPGLTLTTASGLEQIRKLNRFHGDLDETTTNGGGAVRLVPIEPAPH